MNIAYTALVFGLLTGFHCIGMCGPIALTLPLTKGNTASVVSGRLLYNLGRVVTYTLLGVLLGLVGSTFTFAGWQQYISILAGVVIIFLAVVPASLHKLNFFSGVNAFLSKRLSGFLSNGSYINLFSIGLLNGLLPCGPVYIALTAAIGVGSIGGSALYMALFGLGTIPIMFAFSVAANWFSASLRRKINRLIPIFSILLGVFFILRGLNLGIPYLSPNVDMIKNKVENGQPLHGKHGTPDPAAAGCCGGHQPTPTPKHSDAGCCHSTATDTTTPNHTDTASCCNTHSTQAPKTNEAPCCH